MTKALFVLYCLSALSGCRDAGSLFGAPAPSPSASAAPSVSASNAVVPPSASVAPAPKPPLEILKFRFADGVRGKEPKTELSSAAPGQRVWAHLTLRNKGSEKRGVTVVFRVNGDKRTTLDLVVEPSLSFRTWGYNTLRDSDAGELSVEATDDVGTTLVSEKIAIRKTAPGGK